MEACENCGVAFDAAAIACPYCRAPRGLTGLSRAPREDDRLMRIETEDLLARSDARLEDLLTRDLAGPLAPGELRDALVRVDERLDPSVADLENALAADAGIALDGITLAELVDARGDDLKIVKRGLVFLKNKRYREALEWFTLHREALDPARERLGLLLLLMEGFTHRLAGDHRRADEVRARIVAHPLYRRMRGLGRT
jgi:tetratricopeptide (TPR) repeat protein